MVVSGLTSFGRERPVLTAGAGNVIDLDEDYQKADLLNRAAMHGKADFRPPADAERDVTVTIVRKERDDEGHEKLELEDINYHSNMQEFRQDRHAKNEKPGVHRTQLKEALKEKINARKRQARMMQEQAQKMEEEEQEDYSDQEDDEPEEDTESEDSEDAESDSEDCEDENEAFVDTRERTHSRKNHFLDDEAEDADSEDHDEEEYCDAGQGSEDEIEPLILEGPTEENFAEKTCPSGEETDVKSQGPTPSVDITSVDTPPVDTPPVDTPSVDTPSVDTPSLTQILSMECRNVTWTPFDQRSDSVSFQEGQQRKKQGFEALVDPVESNSNDIDDVIGLCSGQFTERDTQDTVILSGPDTQNTLASNRQDTDTDTLSFVITPGRPSAVETPDTLILSHGTHEIGDSEQDEAICEDSDNDQPSLVIGRQRRRNKFIANIDSDDEGGQERVVKSDVIEEGDAEAPGFMEESVGGTRDLVDHGLSSSVARNNRKRKRIVDLHDSEDDGEDGSDNEGNKRESRGNTDDEADLEYDSEENEVQFEASSKFKGFHGKHGLRKEYVEEEAELSGSDAGSEDEDERGLNRLELEEGDFDELDEEQIRDEVGKIHQRRLLDDDKRDLNLFKEAFLEDGDLHSEKARTRQFKWQGIDDSQELNQRQSDDEDGEDVPEAWDKRRMERIEREKWIEENRGNESHEIMDGDGEEDSQFFHLASKAMRKIEVKRQTSREEKCPKPRQSPAKLPLPTASCKPRGSFLSRSAKSLEKLAVIARAKDEVRAGSGPKNSRNFVFATVSSPEKQPETGDHSSTKRGARSKCDVPKQTISKKPRVDRSIDENSMDTIFGFM